MHLFEKKIEMFLAKEILQLSGVSNIHISYSRINFATNSYKIWRNLAVITIIATLNSRLCIWTVRDRKKLSILNPIWFLRRFSKILPYSRIEAFLNLLLVIKCLRQRQQTNRLFSKSPEPFFNVWAEKKIFPNLFVAIPILLRAYMRKRKSNNFNRKYVRKDFYRHSRVTSCTIPNFQ